MKIVDMSHKLFNGSPNYPSDPIISIRKEKDIIKERSLMHSINFGTHSGTHLDVPAHMIKNGKTLDEFPLNAFMGIAIKISKQNFAKLLDYKRKFDTVIYDTGWYKNYDKPEIFFGKNRPIIPKQLIKLVLSKEIKIFGCDLPSVDDSGVIDKVVHKLFLKDNIILYESLTNLDCLPMLEPFEFYGLPLPMVGVDGSPTRAIGIIKSNGS